MKGKTVSFSNTFLGCHNNTGKRTQLMKISFIGKLKYENFYQLGAYKGSATLITVFLIKMKRIGKVYKEVKMCLKL